MKRLIFFVCFFTAALLSYAQQKEVTGVVLDETGFPVSDISVKVEKSSVEVFTDINGEFSISIPDGVTQQLEIGGEGYNTRSINVANLTTVEVTLEPDSKVNELEEVVVVAYGTQKREELTGSVGRVDSRAFEDRPIARVDQALTGQIAGVKTRATTGKPGEGMQIRVRGTASISADNSPVYVVDGMVIDDLSSIAPEDISSIEVLKDAASTAMYGSRGSNGVVIVTTKKGKLGKPIFTYSQYYGIQQIEKKLDVMTADEWIDYVSESINNRWVALDPTNHSASDSYDVRAQYFGLANATDYNLANVNYMVDPRWGTDQVAYIDWQDAFYRAAPIQNYQLSARGGGENVKYMISGGYFQQDGLAINTGFSRVNFSSDVDVNISDKWRAGISFRPTYSWTYGNSVDGKDNEAHKMLAMVPIAELNAGVYTNFWNNTRYRWASSSSSPVGMMEAISNKTEQLRLLTNVYLSYDIFNTLNLKVSGGATNNFSINNNYNPTTNLITNLPGQTSTASRTVNNFNRYLGEALLTYNQTFGKHKLNAIAGFSIENYRTTRQYSRHRGFPNDDLETFNMGASQTVLNSEYTASEWMLISYFGRLNYAFNDKYMLSASIRRDGSSRFGWNNLWGNFAAYGAAWNIHKENFLNDQKWLNNFKIRYSWGENGNNSIGDYRAFGTLGSDNYSFGGNILNGQVPNTIPNPDLTWEKTQSSDFGLELGFFERIDIVADYYVKKTNDLLLQQPVPFVTGYASMWKNIGSVENKGFEFELRTKNLVGDFKWSTNANIAFNDNRVLKLGGDGSPIYTGWSGQTNIIQEGEELNSFYLLKAIGVLSTDDINNPNIAKTAGAIAGDVKYYDFNGDGVINEEDIHIVGAPTPDFYYGFTNTFEYKNFDLTIFFQGQQGGQSYALLGRAFDRPGMGTGTNVLGRWADRWRSDENPGDGQTPRLDGTTGGLLDTRWLYDASYIQLKNITLGYNFPKELTEKLKITAFRLYVSLENVWRNDNYYGGYNPEAVQSDGTDYGAYPSPKIYTIGLNVNF